MNKKYSFILALLLTLLFLNLFFIFSNKPNLLSFFTIKERTLVKLERVIDGDTFVADDGKTIRMININTPEKNHRGYEEAKSFLKSFENQTLEIEVIGKEKYGRILARVYAKNIYLNLEIIKKGLGNKFLVQEKEIKEFYEAEEQAIKTSRGIWKSSKYKECVKLKIFPKEERVLIKNSCPQINFKNFVIKDESRKEYKFPDISFSEITLNSMQGKNNDSDLFWNIEEVWNDDRDTAYLFDSEKNLVTHETYGY